MYKLLVILFIIHSVTTTAVGGEGKWEGGEKGWGTKKERKGERREKGRNVGKEEKYGYQGLRNIA